MEEVVSDIPLITNDAVVFGILILILALIFKSSEMPRLNKFYKIIPALLLCYFIPSIFSTLGIISPMWIDLDAGLDALASNGHNISELDSFKAFKNYVLNDKNKVAKEFLDPYIGKSNLYFVASRYMLPASLVLLTLSINLKEVFNLGYKALVMFITGTIGVIIGGPIAILLFSYLAPDVVGGASPHEVWRGMTTIAGSWIGGSSHV